MSFQQGLSGLNATSKSLQIIGNNIANANTFGAKVARAEFSDMYAAALSGTGSNTIGIGTNLAAVSQQFTQGNISTTENPMDLAMNGAGFFQLTDGKSPVSYSRNGQFKIDRDGFIVNNSGLQLMGYAANDEGVIQPGQAVSLQLPTGGISPLPTSTIALEMNLDSRKADITPGAPMINFNNATTYHNATSLTLYDAKGQEVAVSYYFQKVPTAVDPAIPDGTGTWNVYATVNGNPISVDPADPQPITTLVFPPDGSVPTSPAMPFNFDVPASINAAGTSTLAIPGIQLDLSATTQFGSTFSVTDIAQNGYAAGQLTKIAFDATGIVNATYSNGQMRPAGQLVVANFRNPQGLQPAGDNGWERTFASGDAVTGVPGDGSMGVLQSGALEESNIDLTGELVNMITAQRIYQANAQTIKTQDQVLQTLVNLR